MLNPIQNMSYYYKTVCTNWERRLAVWEDFTDNYNFTLGHNMILILQTIYTNWERQLAVKIYGNLG